MSPRSVPFESWETVGSEVFRWLRDQGWHYVLRASGQNKQAGRTRSAGRVGGESSGTFPSKKGIEEGQTREVGSVRFTEKHDHRKACLIMHWAEGEDEAWYLLSDQPSRPPDASPLRKADVDRRDVRGPEEPRRERGGDKPSPRRAD